MNIGEILESKRICLMKHIIHSEGYEDKELATDLEQGVFSGRRGPEIKCASAQVAACYHDFS